jgi:hypothetical protein
MRAGVEQADVFIGQQVRLGRRGWRGLGRQGRGSVAADGDYGQHVRRVSPRG